MASIIKRAMDSNKSKVMEVVAECVPVQTKPLAMRMEVVYQTLKTRSWRTNLWRLHSANSN